MASFPNSFPPSFPSPSGIQGPESTPYAAGLFRLELEVSARYPFEPPKVRFLTPVFHPNVDDRGRICLDTLKPQPQGSWTPSLNIPTLLTTLRLLLAHPNADDGLAPEPTALYQRDLGGFERRAREHTAQHAMGGGGGRGGGGSVEGGGGGGGELERQGSTILQQGGGKAGGEEVEEGGEEEEEEEEEDEDSKMHVAGEDDDSTASSSINSDGQATDAGSRRSATASRASHASHASSHRPSPHFLQKKQQQQQQHYHQQHQHQHVHMQQGEEEEERGWDSDVSICGDDDGASSSSSSSTLSDDDDDDENINHTYAHGHGQGGWGGEDGREGGRKGEAFVTSAEGMPPRKRARSSVTSSIVSS